MRVASTPWEKQTHETNFNSLLVTGAMLTEECARVTAACGMLAGPIQCRKQKDVPAAQQSEEEQ